MPTDQDWVTTRIREARNQHPLVTETASGHMAELLNGQLSEQQLSQKELTALANALMADMTPPHPDATRSDED